MTECQVLSLQSGSSLQTATKGEEQGSEEYEHSIAAYHSSSLVAPIRAAGMEGTVALDARCCLDVRDSKQKAEQQISPAEGEVRRMHSPLQD